MLKLTRVTGIWTLGTGLDSGCSCKHLRLTPRQTAASRRCPEEWVCLPRFCPPRSGHQPSDAVALSWLRPGCTLQGKGWGRKLNTTGCAQRLRQPLMLRLLRPLPCYDSNTCLSGSELPCRPLILACCSPGPSLAVGRNLLLMDVIVDGWEVA